MESKKQVKLEFWTDMWINEKFKASRSWQIMRRAKKDKSKNINAVDMSLHFAWFSEKMGYSYRDKETGRLLNSLKYSRSEMEWEFKRYLSDRKKAKDILSKKYLSKMDKIEKIKRIQEKWNYHNINLLAYKTNND